MKPLQSYTLKTYVIPSFHLFGTLGFLLGTTLGIALTLHQNLPLWPLALMSLLGAIQLFAHTWIQKLLTGEENIVYYRHEIAILALCALVLWAIGQPVATFLDITLLGVGTCMAFGRIGCYHVGCCHGRPCRVGVRYTQAHANEGFPWYYVGVPLFPIPLLESALVFFTVIVGIWIMWQGFPAGTVLIWHTMFYGSARFVLEFFRGDPERPYWRGLSEAQWTSLGLATLTLAGSFWGALPWYVGQVWVVGLLWFAALIVMVLHRKWGRFRVLNPVHIREFFQHIHELEHHSGTPNALPATKKTRLGLTCSCGTLHKDSSTFQHFTFSSQNPLLRLDRPAMEGLEFYLRMSRHYRKKGEVLDRRNGIFHLTFWLERMIQPIDSR